MFKKVGYLILGDLLKRVNQNITTMKYLIKIIIIAFLFVCLIAILKSCKKITLPEVTTSSVRDVTATNAVSGGNVTNNGGAEVIARGVCWNTVNNPTVNQSKSSNGKGNGTFESEITGLEAGKEYHVRAYATNSEGTNYGNDIKFSTQCQAPIAATSAASNIGPNAATLNGTINAGGSSTTVTFEYGTTTGYGNVVTAAQSPLTGTSNSSISAGLSGLTLNTTYHYRVKAENCAGPVYGSDQIFQTGCTAPSMPTVGTITQPTCSVATGSVVLSGLPSSGKWTLTRTPGGTTTSGTGTTITVSGLPAATTYTFTVTNASGCVSAASGSVAIGAQPTAPSAATDPATSVSSTTATLNGTVNANGASTTVTFLYGTTTSYGNTATASQSPATGNSSTSVSTVISGLTTSTEYHYQVKAENCKGTNSGLDQQFTTPSGCSDAYEPNNTIATATTNAFSSLGSRNYSHAIYPTIDYGSDVDYFRLDITTPGGLTVNLYNPVTDFDIELLNASGETIAFSNKGLTDTITYPVTGSGSYYIKVHGSGSYTCATYTLGVQWKNGSGSGTFRDNRDSQEYKWVFIGSQVWMAENLRATKYTNGPSIPLVTDNDRWVNLSTSSTPSYCWYNNDPVTYAKPYGALYNWYAVNSVYLCPDGWHLPSDAEWTVLTTYLGGIDIAGGKMKEGGTSHWTSPNTDGTNTSGFTGLPASYRSQSSGLFINFGTYALYWSGTEYNSTSAWGRGLYNLDGTVYVYSYPKGHGFSVRCIKD